LNISEIVLDRALVPKKTNRKWPTGNRMATLTWPITSRDPERANSWLQYLENSWDAISQQSLLLL